MKSVNMRGATWDSVFLTIVKLVTTLTAILQTKILSVGLSLADYGTYSQANVIVSICTSILLLGLGDAINYFYNNASNEYDESKRITMVNTIYAIEIVIGIALVFVILICRNGIASYFSNDYLSIVVSVVAIKPMLDNLIYFYQVLFVSSGKAKIIAIRNLILSICKLVSIGIAVHVFRSIIVIFIFLVLLDVIQMMFFATYFSKNRFKVKPYKANLGYIRTIIAYGFPMGVFAITTALTRDIDKLVIGYMSDTETVAVYSNCAKVLPLDIIVVSFATVLIPYIMKYISSGNRKGSIELFKNYLKIGYYSVWIFGVAILVVANQAICFLYSSEYLSGKVIFNIYIFDSMIKFASMHLILTASGNARLLMRYSLLSLLANTVLNILLYYSLGIIGPAIATLIVTLGYTLVILNKTLKVVNAKWKDIFEIKNMTIYILGLCFWGVVFKFVNNLMLKCNINQYVAMIVTMIGFGIMNLLSNHKSIKSVLQSINMLKL